MSEHECFSTLIIWKMEGGVLEWEGGSRVRGVVVVEVRGGRVGGWLGGGWNGSGWSERG